MVIIPRQMLQTGLVIIISLALLKVSKPISAPIVLALTLGVIVSPLVDAAARWRIPSVVMALITTAGLCLALLTILVILAPAIESAALRIPAVITEVQSTLEGLLAIGQNIKDVSNEVSNAINSDAGLIPDQGGGGGGAELPSIWDAVLYAPQVAGQALVFLGTLFFFVLTRGQIYDWLGRTIPGRTPEQSVADLLHWADMSVSRYFVTITAVNALLGLAVFVGLYSFGLPAAAVWGVVAFLLNYLLYLGPALFAVMLLFAGHVEFSGLMSFGPFAMYILLNITEGYVVTPSLVGHRLTLNPLLIFLTLTVGLWLWGAVGGIVALPLLVWTMAVAGQIPAPEVDPIPAQG